LLGSVREVFHAKIKVLFCAWIEAIAKVLIETGMDEVLAQQRAQDVAIAIQGSLILAQGLDDPSPFRHIIQQLPQEICRDAL
jgi:TetR/AcrR family transcriptional regulator, lmrAB and yxaGH operons repressor